MFVAHIIAGRLGLQYSVAVCLFFALERFVEIVDTRLADVKVVRPKIHGDHRGFFSEIFRSE